MSQEWLMNNKQIEVFICAHEREREKEENNDTESDYTK
jgi:hypothetical protein